MSAILVVDDEKSIQVSLSMILSDAGHRIDIAADGVEALEYLQETTYDLVLSDIRMPRMDGMALLKTIQQQWGSQVPVILISAYANETTVTQALDLGARDLIVKPFDVQTVRDAVQYVLVKNVLPPIEELSHKQKTKIEERRQDQETQKKLLEFSVLDEIGKTVGAMPGIEKIGSTIISMVQQILGADNALLVIYRTNRSGFLYRCSYVDGEVSLDDPSATDDYVLEWLHKNRRTLYVREVEKDPEFADCFLSGSLLAVPFMRKSQVLGAIILYKKTGDEFLDGGAQQFLSVMASMATAAIENTHLYNELKGYFQGTVKALIATLEAKDSFLYSHAVRTARYARMMARSLKLNEIEQRRLEYLAMLHDIGKIAIPETILRQQSKRSEWEERILRTHVEVGENIMCNIDFLPHGGAVVRHHHERYDGQGYPDGLARDAIPLFARIIAIANVFDMLTSDYPGVTRLDHSQAMKHMIREAGKSFDPELLKLFLEAFRKTLI
ncbi:response regulator [bacterium]|nr:response regulator [bacterium]